MAELNLTQAEADTLIAMAKYRIDQRAWAYPDLGSKVSIPLESEDRRERFVLDLSRGRIDLRKGTWQNRGRNVVVLVRLDFGGPPHRNPDGEEVGSPHLHVYREGYADKWAMSLPAEQFEHRDDPWLMLEEFMRFCNIVEPPAIQRGLFA